MAGVGLARAVEMTGRTLAGAFTLDAFTLGAFTLDVFAWVDLATGFAVSCDERAASAALDKTSNRADATRKPDAPALRFRISWSP